MSARVRKTRLVCFFCITLLVLFIVSIFGVFAADASNTDYRQPGEESINSSEDSETGSERDDEDSSGPSTGLTIVVVLLLLWAITAFFAPPSKKNKKTSSAHWTPSRRYDQVLSEVDVMRGIDFEYWCADLLKYNGFSNISVTPGSGDQGVDIIAWGNNQKYAIQCKRVSKKLGNKPVQEVNTGRTIYGCSRAAVMTNQFFTRGALNAANAVGVELWDRNTLAIMLKRKNAAIYQQSREYRKQQRNQRIELERQIREEKRQRRFEEKERERAQKRESQ